LKPYEEDSIEIDGVRLEVDCPETDVTDQSIARLVSECDIDHSVPPSRMYKGGTVNAHIR
jgi:hypothetical protein